MQMVTTAAVFAILGLNVYAFVMYIRLRRIVAHVTNPLLRKMECDDLIDQMLSLDTQEGRSAAPEVGTAASATIDTERQDKRRARLAAIVAGGTAHKYLGKQLTLAQVDEMTDDEVSKQYGRYEARLGASMTKTLGATVLQMYALAAGTFLPIPTEKRTELVSDLEDDPFVEHALTTFCCELYYRYGMYLAPLTAAMTTVKHCRVEAKGSPTHITENGDTADGFIRDDGGGDDLPNVQ